jgi:glycosyltransferase involved in cell wall biosynthesis
MQTVGLCFIFRQNADTIDAFLRSVHGQFDEIIAVDTALPGDEDDGTARTIKRYLNKNKVQGRVISFPWCDDFSAARQKSFEASTTDWRMFLDTDDRLDGPPNAIRKIVNSLIPPDAQGVFFPYDFDKDEYFPTLRLVRWADGWVWRDAVHERIGLIDESKQANLVAVNDVVVRHTYKTPERKARSMSRNAAIALREFTNTDDTRYAARLARALYSEAKMRQDFPAAESYLRYAYTHAEPSPERSKAAADLMAISLSRDEHDLALMYAKDAGPSYEAMALAAAGKIDEAIPLYIKGIPDEQQTTHESFILEHAGVKVDFASSLLRRNNAHPAHEVERLLNKIRPDLREHEIVLKTVLNIRAHLDRITILVPGTPQPFDEDSLGSMLGGSEEAVVHLSQALARLGRNVRVYGTLPAHRGAHFDKAGVEWAPYQDFKLGDEHGFLVVWRSLPTLINILDSILKDPKKGIGINGGSLWMHDFHTGVDPHVFQAVANAVTNVITLSQAHTDVVEYQAGKVANIEQIGNGIDPDGFLRPDAWPDRDPMSVIYSSCPSRGLSVLLDVWPEVKAAVPQAKLDLYYDWSMLARFQPTAYAKIQAAYDAVKHLDVIHHGGVGHDRLHSALERCNVWAYSYFEQTVVETFCISAVKATVAGADVLTVPNGALPEVAPEADFATDRDTYRDKLIEKLLNPTPFSVRRDKALRARERFSWSKVAERFSQAWTVLKRPGKDVPPTT